MLADWWASVVRAEHAFERALGFHPAPDPPATDGPSPSPSPGPSGEPSSGTPSSWPAPSSAPPSMSPAPAAGPSLMPHAGNPFSAQRIRTLAADLQRFWPAVTGRADAMPAAALELALAQAGLESTWGAGW